MDGLDADWTLAERERISSIRIRGMIALMHWHGGNRDYEDALRDRPAASARGSVPRGRADRHDVALRAQRPASRAIKQYESFAELLRNELSIEPMRETQALYVHIRNELDRRPQR